MMFQQQPIDLARQLQGLHLKDAASLTPDHHLQQAAQNGVWAHQQTSSGWPIVPGQSAGKEAGQALLKLLQGGSKPEGHRQQHPSLGQEQQVLQQEGHAQHISATPDLSLSFLNGTAAALAQTSDDLVGGMQGLFGATPTTGSAAAQEALPSLFVGNSIWSTSHSTTDATVAGTSSLWGSSSIWSPQQEGWLAAQQQSQNLQLPPQQQEPSLRPPSQQEPQQRQPQPLSLLIGSQAPGSRLSPLPSPRYSHDQYKHQQQQQQNAQHPLPRQIQINGYNPMSLAQQPQQHRLQQPFEQQPQHSVFPPQHPPPPPPAYPPNHIHHPSSGVVFSSGHQTTYPSQPAPFPAGSQGLPSEFPLGVGLPGSLLGMGAGSGTLRIPPPLGPPPPPPPGISHAPKFAPHTQQQVQGLPLVEDRLKLPAHVQQVNGVAGARTGPYLQAPKVMRHQQLKQGPGFSNNYSPKHGGPRESRWVEVMDRSHTGRLPRSDLGQLDARLLTLVESLAPTPEEQQRQRSAFERVREVLQRSWPNARVHLFGSVANGLSVRSNNDLDVCLEMEDVGDDQVAKGEIATKLGDVLREVGMADVLPLPKARVPVVKFVVPETGIKVDVTVNNILACINTKLLADYAAVDPRLSQLVTLVKHWAKQRAVNDSYRGTLSSYCYVLMCIHLLQTRCPPVLPSLQQMPPTFRREVAQWKCEFFDQVESLQDFGSDNNESLGQLVWSFFEYWAWRHDYATDVISVRTGGFLRKEDKDWTRRIGNERHLVCIEDPFELSHDLGRTVDRQTKSVLHKEFIRAATLLRDAPDPLEKLLEPYRVGRT